MVGKIKYPVGETPIENTSYRRIYIYKYLIYISSSPIIFHSIEEYKKIYIE